MSNTDKPQLHVPPKGYGLVFDDARVFFWNAQTLGSKENELLFGYLQEQFTREDIADYATIAYAGLQQSPNQEAIRLNLSDFVYIPEYNALQYYALQVNYPADGVSTNTSITVTGNMIAAWIHLLKDTSLSLNVENPNWAITHQAPVVVALHWMEEATHAHQFRTGETTHADLVYDAQVRARHHGVAEGTFYDELRLEVATRRYLHAAEPVLDQNPEIAAAAGRIRDRAEQEHNHPSQDQKPDEWARS